MATKKLVIEVDEHGAEQWAYAFRNYNLRTIYIRNGDNNNLTAVEL